jgi:hypothetical protein
VGVLLRLPGPVQVEAGSPLPTQPLEESVSNNIIPSITIAVDGQVRLVHLQIDSSCLHDKQTVNGIREIAWASLFCLKRQRKYIDIYAAVSMYIYIYGRRN